MTLTVYIECDCGKEHEVELDYTYTPERKGRHTMPNGDPGYPTDPESVEVEFPEELKLPCGRVFEQTEKWKNEVEEKAIDKGKKNLEDEEIEMAIQVYEHRMSDMY